VRLSLALLAVSLLTACIASAPRQPANIVLPDIHNGGTALSFSPDSRLLASAGIEGWLFVWQSAQGEKMASWRAHDGQITGMAFVDGQTLISAGLDARLRRWHRTGELLQEKTLHAAISALALAPQLGLVLVGMADGQVQKRALDDLRLLDSERFSGQRIRALAIDGSGQTFAVADQRMVWLWRADGSRRVLQTPSTYPRAMAFERHSGQLLGAGWYFLYRWDTASGALQKLRTEHRGAINDIALSADEASVLTISRQTDAAVLYLDPLTGKTLHRLQSHELCGGAVAISADGRYVASSGDDASVRIWDMRQPLPMR